jgi:hypothetical protein
MDENTSYSVVSNLSSDSTDDSSNNVLAALKAVISKSVKRPDIFIEVPERPGVTVRISPNVTQNQLRAWRKNAGDETKAGMDTVKFACAVVGHTTTGIAFNGEVVSDDRGTDLTFASPEILAMTNTTRPLPDCVKAFFGIEPHVEAAAVAIMEAAGYGDTVETADPTRTSSTN